MTTQGLPMVLEDVRVLELADDKAQYCGKLLADMGADVIKIEPPGGAAARRIGPFYQDLPHHDRSLYFWHYNTNKRGVTLNLETADGRAFFKRLAATATVVLESFTPGYLDNLGLGYAGLARIRPDLILTSLTYFGQTGPWRHLESSDLVSIALGGPMISCGYDDHSLPPIRGGMYQAFHTGSHHAFLGTLLALYARDLTGEGQHVDASIHESLSNTTEGQMGTYLTDKGMVQRQTGRHHSVNPTAPWQHPCKDGRYVNLSNLGRDTKTFTQVVAWMAGQGFAGDLQDPKYQDPAVRRAEGQHIAEVIGAFCQEHTFEEVYRGFQQFEIPCGEIRSPDENLEDPHWADRGFFVEVEHPELGQRFVYPGAPYQFMETPWRVRRRAPLLGEHNREVYVAELGVSPQHLAVFAEAGVV